MLLTGFDAPPIHTLYMDRPMRGANLMQALARVNRRFRGKQEACSSATRRSPRTCEKALGEYSPSDRQDQTRPWVETSSGPSPMSCNEHATICGLLAGIAWRALLADTLRPQPAGAPWPGRQPSA